MKVYWIGQTEINVPGNDEWLSANEVACLGRMKIPKRRADWRLGRWTAKCAVAVYFRLQLSPDTFAGIELRPAASGAPEPFVGNEPAAFAISLSHRDGTAMCAIGPSGAALGCDLELIEPHSDGFIGDFFAAKEQEFLARAGATERDRLVALFWSAKESALKALRVGLRLDTRSVLVSSADSLTDTFPPHEWHPLHVCVAGPTTLAGWWQHDGRLVRTMVGVPPPLSPIALQTASDLVHLYPASPAACA